MRPTLAPRLAGCIAFAAATASIVPVAAHAQESAAAALASSATRIADTRLADSLDRQAFALYATPAGWGTAARLHERAAQLRARDAGAVTSLRHAGWMYSLLGNLITARERMVEAAELAEALGDLELAAHCYVDAAVLASGEQRGDIATRMVHDARRLAGASDVTERGRTEILARIAVTPALHEPGWRTAPEGSRPVYARGDP